MLSCSHRSPPSSLLAEVTWWGHALPAELLSALLCLGSGCWTLLERLMAARAEVGVPQAATAASAAALISAMSAAARARARSLASWAAGPSGRERPTEPLRGFEAAKGLLGWACGCESETITTVPGLTAAAGPAASGGPCQLVTTIGEPPGWWAKREAIGDSSAGDSGEFAEGESGAASPSAAGRVRTRAVKPSSRDSRFGVYSGPARVVIARLVRPLACGSV